MSRFYFSRSTKGFYSSLVSGVRTLTTVDPSWTPPMKLVPDPAWEPPTKMIPDPAWVAPDDQPDAIAPEIEVIDSDAVRPEIEVPDFDAVGPIVTIPNPDCKIPADAVEITPEQHVAMLVGEQAGQIIDADQDGHPILKKKPKVKPNAKGLKHLRRAVTAHLDDLAEDWGFDSILDAVSYAFSDDPESRQRAQALSAYRDQCRAATKPRYAAMLAETETIPEGDAFIASLPPAPTLP